MNSKLILALFALGSVAGDTHAALVAYDNPVAFLAATGAASVGGFPSGTHVSTFTAGSAGFAIVAPSTFSFGEWTTRLPGTDMGINGVEQFDVSFNQATYSFGFDFVEPERDPNVNAPFVDSTFELSFYSAGALVGTHTFNAPNDVAAFVGVSSSSPFDKVEVRETTGNIENEFFGTFYSGQRRFSSVPDGGNGLIMLGGACGILFSARGWQRARRGA